MAGGHFLSIGSRGQIESACIPQVRCTHPMAKLPGYGDAVDKVWELPEAYDGGGFTRYVAGDVNRSSNSKTLAVAFERHAKAQTSKGRTGGENANVKKKYEKKAKELKAYEEYLAELLEFVKDSASTASAFL